jgi:hypothetical protein
MLGKGSPERTKLLPKIFGDILSEVKFTKPVSP